MNAEGRDVRMRWGPGPVFVYEWLVRSRSWRMYGQRVLFAGAILAGLLLMGAVFLDGPGRSMTNGTASIQELARMGQALFATVAFVELTMVLLVAPAATAGAVCTDKMRGTLEHMLVTDLSNVEIVLGKLAVRLAPVLGLIACVLPITALSGLFGGIDPTELGGSFLVAIGSAVCTCSLALLLSVWGRKAHEVLIMAYMLIVLWLIAPLLIVFGWETWAWWSGKGPTAVPYWTEWAFSSNPYYLVFRPSWRGPGAAGWTTYLAFLGACLGLSLLMAGWATLRVRAVSARQAGAGSETRSRSRPRRLALRLDRVLRYFNPLELLPGPSLDGNPVLWREWHRARPSRMLRVAWLMYSGLGLFWLALMIYIVLTPEMHFRNSGVEMASYANAFQVGLGLLLLSVGASTSLGEERARGSLDLLMSTPLSTRSILAGKWLGTYRQAALVLFWPAATGAFLVLVDFRRAFPYLIALALISAYGAVVVSLGLLLAVCVRQAGRAVALCVAIVVGLAIAWPIVLLLVVVVTDLPHSRTAEHFLTSMVMGSPLFGVPLSTGLMSMESVPGTIADFPWIVLATCGWTIVLWAGAGLLFVPALAEFEPRLGRMPEESETVVRPRRRTRMPNRDLIVDEGEDDGEGVTVLEAGDATATAAPAPAPSADGITFLDAEAGAGD